MVYILAKDGTPLMLTENCGYVRQLLDAHRAVVVCRKPFTVRLKYQTDKKTQPLVCGIDPGRTNIGIAVVTEEGSCQFSANAVTNNKEVPKRMAERKTHRQASRQGERLRRQRRAVANGTCFEGETMEQVLPGCEKPIICKLRNSEARFNNRVRPEGWLTPTENHLLACHLNLLTKVQKLLPISMVVLEVNKFAFRAMDNPNIQRWQYQKGPLYSKGSVKDAVFASQDGHCLFCDRAIEHYHHITPRSKGGSETLANRVGLCEEHHTLIHKDAGSGEKVTDTKAGLNKKYGALSVLNQIIPKLTQRLAETGLPVRVTDGWSTKAYRDAHGIAKDHNLDAYCIACSVLDNQTVIEPPKNHYDMMRFRQHDRAAVNSHEARKYYLNDKLVAWNRNKRMGQTDDSLAEFRTNHPNDVGRIRVAKGKITYKHLDRTLPGAIFSVNGVQMVFKGSKGFYNGKPDYYTFYGTTEKYSPKKCKLISVGGGWRFI